MLYEVITILHTRRDGAGHLIPSQGRPEAEFVSPYPQRPRHRLDMRVVARQQANRTGRVDVSICNRRFGEIFSAGEQVISYNFV